MKYLASLTFMLLITAAASAQFCQPTFTNGCATWQTYSVDLATINWTNALPCDISDHTSTSTTILRGVSYPMTVANGSYCGVAVYMDLDENGAFSDAEALYHTYGGCDGCTYNFTLTVPPSTPPGSKRMRVISAWGTAAGPNDGGPCGGYPYGNFQDFTVEVEASSYCFPTFGSCTSWQLNSVELSGTTWTPGPDCTVYDHTNTTFNVVRGAQTPMIVQNADWSGLSVWIDTDLDLHFSPSEIFYEGYAAVQDATYNFNLLVPTSVPAGTYRMRVMSPWAESGATTGSCSSYQYGNFADFTLVATGQVGIEEHASSGVTIWPNPAQDHATITTNIGKISAAVLVSMDGRMVAPLAYVHSEGQTSIDLGHIPPGSYLIECLIGDVKRVIRLVKE